MKVEVEKTEKVVIEMDGKDARSIIKWLLRNAADVPPHSPVDRLLVKLTNAMAE